MPTSRPLPKAALQYLENAPRGMWYETRDGKPKPAVARWRKTDGSKEGESFESADARAVFAAEWVRQREQFGKDAQLVDATRVRMWAEFRDITGDIDPLTVAREWRAWRGTNDSLSVAKAWEDFNADQEQRKLSADTHSHRRLHGKRICQAFAGKLVASITTEDLTAWISGLLDPDTREPMGTKTKRHHLKTAKHWLEWLKDRRKLDHNCAIAVTVPDVETIDPVTGEVVHREINTLTVDQARELFRANHGAVCVGRLALEAFGGLRYTSAARLRPADLLWDDSGLVMPGHKHKSGNRHFVEGWPSNLWAWLRHAPKACWELVPREYADLKREAFERAGLKPPAPQGSRNWTPEEAAQFDAMKNVLRHSFATYHLAAYKDAKLTAYLMTKRSIQSLNNDYRGRATHAQGLAYAGIVP